MGFEDFEPIFGEAKPELDKGENWEQKLHPFLFYIYGFDHSRLRMIVTDFHSNTFETVRTTIQLEDLSDAIGVGGSWSEFVDYLISSVSSDSVKVVLGGLQKSTSNSGATHAKLTARKSKGMPLISLPLDKLVNSSANDAIAFLSLELFKAFSMKRNEVVKAEQERPCQLTTKVLAAEQEKMESTQSQLNTAAFSRKRKQQNLNASDDMFSISGAPSGLDTLSVSGMQESSDKPIAYDPQSAKGSKRVVPAYRRVKVRGACLQDTGDDNGN